MENKDELVGRAKEAVGDLTDDDSMKREGKVDRATGEAKESIEKAADKMKSWFAKTDHPHRG